MTSPRLHTAGDSRPRTGLRSAALVCGVLALAAPVLRGGDDTSLLPAGIEALLAVLAFAGVSSAAVTGRTAEVNPQGPRIAAGAAVLCLAVVLIGDLAKGFSGSTVLVLMALMLAVVVMVGVHRSRPVVSQRSRDRLAGLELRRDEKRGGPGRS